MATATAARTRDSKYVKLAAEFRRQIATGHLRPGDRLPSYARMLSEYGVRQNTAEKVFALLDQEKLIVREPNRGTFVAEPNEIRKTGAIGISIDSAEPASRHPYYLQLLGAIQREAHAARVEIVILHVDSYIGLEKIDGILLCEGHCDRTMNKLPLGLPAVSMVHPSHLAPSIVADEGSGIVAAMEHLLQTGHRKIAYLNCAVQSWSNPSSRIRHAAYLRALREAGIEADSSWSRPVFRDCDDNVGFDWAGFERMKQWIEEDWRELGCTALLAHNDDAAVGAIRALRQAGIAVPGEVSVVGFDGTEVATASDPRLTTIELPLEEIGARAAKLLLDLIAADCSPGSETDLLGNSEKLPARLRVRESTSQICKE